MGMARGRTTYEVVHPTVNVHLFISMARIARIQAPIRKNVRNKDDLELCVWVTVCVCVCVCVCVSPTALLVNRI